MKFCTSIMLLFLCGCITAQPVQQHMLYLEGGAVQPIQNITKEFIRQFNEQREVVDGKSYCIVQLDKPADGRSQTNYQDAGIRLLEYIPSNAYLAEINRPLEYTQLTKLHLRALVKILPHQKIRAEFKNQLSTTPIKVWAMLYNTVDVDTAIALISGQGYQITAVVSREYRVLEISIKGISISALAGLPVIKYVEQAAPPPESLLNDSRSLSRANLLQTGLPGGYNLTGEGVVIGVAEVYGSPYPHVDFADRTIALSPSFNEVHSTMVNGIIGGAGLVNELYTGFAPRATLITSTSNTFRGPNFERYGMVITNNSYSTGYSCYLGTGSKIYQAVYDIQATGFPYVQNVWATGNSGGTVCSAYPSGFGTGLAGAGGSKSVIAVGNTLKDGSLFYSSSRGPAVGGRIKPDVTATGSAVFSTSPNNSYSSGFGTSFSSPAVVGGLALMYERYRQLNKNQNPTAALMKSIVCNTANDAGNKGPDFSFGFGEMNVYRAIKAIDSTHYFVDSVHNHEQVKKTITVPAGGAQLKILLYWQDPSASVLSSRYLVNDLDLTVVSPSGAIHLPYILDTTAANVANPAVEGADHINNTEQVIIDFPEAGTYTVNIRGSEIDDVINPTQSFALTYDLLPNAVMLTYPFGNEHLLPAEGIKIQWDAWGTLNETFRLEFSSDDGATWSLIDNSVHTEQGQFDWKLPNITTTQARMRITRNSDQFISTSGRFALIGQPVIGFTSDQCPGSISIQWNPVNGADYYELMRIKGGNMVVVDTTSKNNYSFRSLSEDSIYWVTVRAVVGGLKGRRAVALSRQPNIGNCSLPIFDNDFKVDSILIQTIARQYTSTELTAHQDIAVRIKNLDDVSADSCSVGYSVDGGNWVIEKVHASIPPLSSYTHHFSTAYDFSHPGEYLIKAFVTNYKFDNYKNNDTLQITVRQLPNFALNPDSVFSEGFDSAYDSSYQRSSTGISGVERFDYSPEGQNGELRFPQNSLSGKSGKSLQFNFQERTPRISGIPFRQAVTGTFNLSAYDTAQDNVLLSFKLGADWRCIGCSGDSSKILVRGNDMLPWIEITKLNAAQDHSISKELKGLDISKTLRNAKQNFSTSSQIQWQYASQLSSYLIDDIILYNNKNKPTITFADTLNTITCGIGNRLVRVNINNPLPNELTDVEVYYRVNEGELTREKILVVPSNSVFLFTFSKIANLTKPGLYTLEAGLISTDQAYNENANAKETFRNQPLITTFPYLEDFETNDGNWYAEGRNSSWVYGRPASSLINKAASGNGAWKTNLAGRHNTNELSYLYSPCIDYSGLPNPTLSFSLALNLDSCGGANCDLLRIEYSEDGLNWNYIPSNPGYHWNEGSWGSRTYYRWHVISNQLPAAHGPIRLRFVFKSDYANTFEGASIDDIHIYDGSYPIYDTIVPTSPVVRAIVKSNTWTDFTVDSKILAAINPYSQNLGNTIFTTYIKQKTPGPNFHGQYYLSRNFTISAENEHPSDSIGVRLFITDNETDSLLFAGNCPACYKPADAYRLGVSQYESNHKGEENDTISDNVKGIWKYIENRNVKTVPYNNGYYLEFKVKELSELWLNSGGTDGLSWLPVKVINFKAEKSLSGTQVMWNSAAEINIKYFEVQIAETNQALAGNNFSVIATVFSHGASSQSQSYAYLDADRTKEGVHYYRIKAVDEFGNYAYSEIIPVVYSNFVTLKVFPNPSDGLYKMEYQAGAGEKLYVVIYDVNGKIVSSKDLISNGFIQLTDIDLKQQGLAAGLYLMRVATNKKSYYFKLIKL